MARLSLRGWCRILADRVKTRLRRNVVEEFGRPRSGTPISTPERRSLPHGGEISSSFHIATESSCSLPDLRNAFKFTPPNCGRPRRPILPAAALDAVGLGGETARQPNGQTSSASRASEG